MARSWRNFFRRSKDEPEAQTQTETPPAPEEGNGTAPQEAAVEDLVEPEDRTAEETEVRPEETVEPDQNASSK